MTEQAGGFPDPSEFPNYDDVDSRAVLDPEDSFSEKEADFEAEPEGGEQ